MGFAATLQLTLSWGDCAPSGAVFYPNYFRWFDAATWNFFETAGLPILELEKKYGTVGIPLLKTEADFRGPVRLQDRLSIETSVSEWQRKTLSLRHLVRKEDAILVEGRDVRFWGVRNASGSGRLKADTIPAEVREHFEALDKSNPG